MRFVIYFLYFTGILSLYRKKNKSPLVLFWHDVSNNASEAIEGESFPADLFRRQIRYLMNHYEIISMDEYYKRYKYKSFTNREVVLTFDDGYKNNLLVAAPILKEYNLPFTVFISANNIEQQKRFYVSIPRLVIIGAKLSHIEISELSYSKDCQTERERVTCAHEVEYKIKYLSHDDAVKVSERLIEHIGADHFNQICIQYPNGNLLTWDDVKDLAKNYNCTIGSHCMDHCICHSNQKGTLIENQIINSKKLIKDRTGLNCVYFAYPNGDYTDFSNAVVRQHYKMGFSTEAIPVYSEKNIASVGRVAVQRSYYIFIYNISMALYRKWKN